MRLLVIGCYSIGTPYEEEAEILKRSLDLAGMGHTILGFESRGDWYANTAMKAATIRSFRQNAKGPLLYIDVDAFVYENCAAYFEHLDEAGVDFGVHYFAGPAGGHDKSKVSASCPACGAPMEIYETACFNCGASPVVPVGHRLLSGTLFFGDTAGAQLLCDRWVARNEALAAGGIREGGGQKNLWRTVSEMEHELVIEKLPGRFCKVFDKPWAYPPNEPTIIEHTIGSRENRDGTRVNEARQVRVNELRKLVGL